eukprot:CAMPEP_0175712270 /NCGR_PEP_ID=MMETSP0097-20121207/41010_1 /TAXON_ID=311494 /ORGANISM="Alexandrium monilatum, Strain CCMP3105" /LENGTH=360 /DNA_ID=CAMNT_0017019713 /DNA_START=22 /DNA_END=1102 /DNA_ORIENTATION=+
MAPFTGGAPDRNERKGPGARDPRQGGAAATVGQVVEASLGIAERIKGPLRAAGRRWHETALRLCMDDCCDDAGPQRRRRQREVRFAVRGVDRSQGDVACLQHGGSAGGQVCPSGCGSLLTGACCSGTLGRSLSGGSCRSLEEDDRPLFGGGAGGPRKLEELTATLHSLLLQAGIAIDGQALAALAERAAAALPGIASRHSRCSEGTIRSSPTPRARPLLARGEPQAFPDFRRYMHEVLADLTSDGLSQEMILQQLIVEVQSGQARCLEVGVAELGAEPSRQQDSATLMDPSPTAGATSMPERSPADLTGARSLASSLSRAAEELLGPRSEENCGMASADASFAIDSRHDRLSFRKLVLRV